MSVWTPERTQTVVDLYTAGLGPSEIGRRFGMTRNQVLAKMVRLGHVRRAASQPRAEKIKPERRPPPNRGGAALVKAIAAARETAAIKAAPPPRSPPRRSVGAAPRRRGRPVHRTPRSAVLVARRRGGR